MVMYVPIVNTLQRNLSFLLTRIKINPMCNSIFIINGSPHTNGYTARLLDCLRDMLGDEVCLKVCNAFAEHFAPCNDCGACKHFQGCSMHDMDSFFFDFENADAVIFCTPIYNMSFPAPLKCIIDRFQRYFNARFSLGIKPPIPKHRPVLLLAVGGDSREDGELMIKQLKKIFTVTNCTLVDSIIFTGTDKLSPADFPPNELCQQIAAALEKLNNFIT